MQSELQEQAMLERVELIARLATEGVCVDRDREIALALIAEIASDKISRNERVKAFFGHKATTLAA